MYFEGTRTAVAGQALIPGERARISPTLFLVDLTLMFRSLPFLTAFTGAFLLLFLSAGCTQPRELLGQAYVAPASLNLRNQIALKSGTVTTLKHGDMVGIVDVQRRMLKVRTASGFEGWVDSASLLSQGQMDELRRDRKAALALPSEGTATAFEVLNVHVAPSRSAAAFTQIPEGGQVAILGRKVSPKISGPARAPAFTVERPQYASRKPRKEQIAKSNFRLPPKPSAPKAPANWQELSTQRIDGAESTRDRQIDREKLAAAATTVPKPVEPQRPVAMEDWTLVRTRANDVGWVLTRNLLMSIPDEVAQYAEGKHITAFFELGTVQDEAKGVKHHWLWTTASMLLPYDFDSWRVFLWNGRRHRYETSYRQHDLEGYFPVHVQPADPNTPLRTFQLVMRDDDGKFRQRTYAFDGTRVHLTGTADYNPAGQVKAESAGSIDTGKLQSKLKAAGWLKRQWLALKQRLGGG